MASEERWVPIDPAEELAQRVLEAHLGVELVGVAPTEHPTVECRTPDGMRAFEVKQLTSEEYVELSNASDRQQTSWDSPVLRWRWMVILDAPSLSDLYAPVPRFADDPPPEDIARYEAVGWKVKTRAEREEEHRHSHPGPKRSSVRLKALGAEIEEPLKVLEDHDVRSTRDGAVSPFDPSPLGRALWAIASRTQNAICLADDPPAGVQPGVDVCISYGGIRTGRPDTLVSRLELWLRSDRSANLKASLRNEAAGVERHAVLVLDPTMEPEYWAAVEAPETFCPTRAPALPEVVDVLWFILGPVTCVYRDEPGWEAGATPHA